jgi:hypothetical protein
LIQANPEKHIGAKSYSHAVRDVLNLPEEAARNIIDEIKVKLTRSSPKKLWTEELWLEGEGTLQFQEPLQSPGLTEQELSDSIGQCIESEVGNPE